MWPCVAWFWLQLWCPRWQWFLPSPSVVASTVASPAMAVLAGTAVLAGMPAAVPQVGCAKGRAFTIPDSADLLSAARASVTQPLQEVGLAKVIFSPTVGSRAAVSTALITTATIFASAQVSVTASVSTAAGDGDGHGGRIPIPRTTKIKNVILSSPTR